MCSYRRSYEECGPVYVREKGELRRVSEALNTEDGPLPSRVKPLRLFQKGFSVQLCVSDRAQTTSPRKDHFIFTYTKEGSLRYSPKSLLNIALKFIAENVQHIDSLIGFPEQMAERLFTAAEEKHTFSDPKTGVKALQTFSEAYGNLVLNSLCLRSRFLLVSEKLEEIKAFSGLRSLDLSCCKLGDDHELLEHLTSEALSSLVHLSLGDNCLSDSGLRKLTAPVRVMKRGLGNLQRLDLSCNPMICAHGIGYLSCFSKLQSLDLSATGVKLNDSLIRMLKDKVGLIRADHPLEDFSHLNCKTEGWAEQVIHQWDSLTSETTKPKTNLQPRTNALRFYGKERCLREVYKTPSLQLSKEESKSREKLQFHKPHQTLTAGNTDSVSHIHKKRVLVSPQEGSSEPMPAPKRQCAAQLSPEDWDILNSY